MTPSERTELVSALRDISEAIYILRDNVETTDRVWNRINESMQSANESIERLNTPAPEGGEKPSCRQCGAPSGNSHCLGDIFNCSDLAAPEGDG